MDLFNTYYQGIMESIVPLLEDEEPALPSSLYAKTFKRILNEDAVRIDQTGKKIKIPTSYTFKEGPDGTGIAVGPCDQLKVDRVGRAHTVPRGYIFKIGKNGKGIVLKPGEATRETKGGQIEKIKQPTLP